MGDNLLGSGAVLDLARNGGCRRIRGLRGAGSHRFNVRHMKKTNAIPMWSGFTKDRIRSDVQKRGLKEVSLAAMLSTRAVRRALSPGVDANQGVMASICRALGYRFSDWQNTGIDSPNQEYAGTIKCHFCGTEGTMVYRFEHGPFLYLVPPAVYIVPSGSRLACAVCTEACKKGWFDAVLSRSITRLEDMPEAPMSQFQARAMNAPLVAFIHAFWAATTKISPVHAKKYVDKPSLVPVPLHYTEGA